MTLEEAEASIALAAISGGMFEIGDDLPTLGESPDRIALVKNPDLLDMVRLGRASLPLDLMTYRPEDKQPSIFLLKETPRQQILTVFNWTTEPSSHMLALADLGLKANGSYTATDVLRGGAVTVENGALSMTLPPQSVRMIKLIDTSVPEAAPVFEGACAGWWTGRRSRGVPCRSRQCRCAGAGVSLGVWRRRERGRRECFARIYTLRTIHSDGDSHGPEWSQSTKNSCHHRHRHGASDLQALREDSVWRN